MCCIMSYDSILWARSKLSHSDVSQTFAQIRSSHISLRIVFRVSVFDVSLCFRRNCSDEISQLATILLTLYERARNARRVSPGYMGKVYEGRARSPHSLGGLKLSNGHDMWWMPRKGCHRYVSSCNFATAIGMCWNFVWDRGPRKCGSFITIVGTPHHKQSVCALACVLCKVHTLSQKRSGWLYSNSGHCSISIRWEFSAS